MYFVVIMGIALGAVSYGWDRGASGIWQPVLGTAAMTLAPAVAGTLFMIYVDRKKRRLSRSGDLYVEPALVLSSRYSRVMRFVNNAVLGAYAASLYLFSWAAMPERLALDRYSTLAAAAIAAPLFVSLVLVWIPLHYAEAMMRAHAPTLRQRLAFNLRQYVLTLVLPIGVVLLVHDAMALLPGAVGRYLENPWVEGTAGLAIVIAGYTFAPLLLVRIWKTRTLKDSPVRSRLEELCGRVGARFRDIRIWETPGHRIVNAAVMGVAGIARYVLVSRTLLELLPAEQVEAVFAHELGHVKRRHIAFYLVFAADFFLLVLLFELMTGSGQSGEAVDSWQYCTALGSIFVLCWGLGFGMVSRIFERDSDLFAADMMGDHRPFAASLMALAHLTGISPSKRSWRHGSIGSRVRFLQAAAASPAVRERFHGKVAFVKAFLVSLAIASIAAMVVLRMTGATS